MFSWLLQCLPNGIAFGCLHGAAPCRQTLEAGGVCVFHRGREGTALLLLFGQSNGSSGHISPKLERKLPPPPFLCSCMRFQIFYEKGISWAYIRSETVISIVRTDSFICSSHHVVPVRNSSLSFIFLYITTSEMKQLVLVKSSELLVTRGIALLWQMGELWVQSFPSLHSSLEGKKKTPPRKRKPNPIKWNPSLLFCSLRRIRRMMVFFEGVGATK